MNPIGYEVYLHGISVGWLIRDSSGRVSFQFTNSYRSLPNRPVLGQKFEDNLKKVYRGDGSRLPPFFANLVPEQGGALRTYLAAAWHVDINDDLALLAAAGADLPGALSIRPRPDALPPLINYETLEEEPEQILVNEDSADRSGPHFSLGGVQMKLSLLRQADKLTFPGPGQLGDWIVKVDSSAFPLLIENEFAIMQWAKSAGFDVPECQIAEITILPEELRSLAPANRPLFLIERYDRASEQSVIHQEDFAQVIGLQPNKKYEHATYEQLAFVVKETVGDAGYVEFIRRLVLMIATGNADAHLKNWSFIYTDRINCLLSPLYDQVATVAWPHVKFEWALKFAGTKDPFAMRLEAFDRLAKRSHGDESTIRRILQHTLDALADGWRDAAIYEKLPSDHLTRLLNYWQRSPLLSEWSKRVLT